MAGETFSIIVSTYGDDQRYIEWAKTAMQSAYNQSVPCEVIRSHKETLAEARNSGAREATGDFLIFLDADDVLHPEYVAEMRKANADLRQPSSADTIDLIPSILPWKDLTRDNYLIIGTAVRRDMFLEYGGFGDYPILEDWALWAKLHCYGATVEPVPAAIYYVNSHPDRRNYQTEEFRDRNYHVILQDIDRWKANALYSRTWN